MNNEQILEQHKKDKKISTDFKERRFAQWNDNYYLYRDKVITNRLSQRQPVNVPIMRETIQTWISKIDEPPFLTFESRTKGNKSEDGQIVMNELWNFYFEELKLDLLDNMDKKIVGLQGRSFKMWGFEKGQIYCDLLDPYDVEVDPKCNPLNLNSATFVIRRNLFVSLRDILANTQYDSEEKNKLKVYLDSKEGIIKAAESQQEWFMRQQRLRILGAYNFDDFGATDTLVELNHSFRMIWDAKEKKFVRYLLIIGADMAVLYKKPLKEAMGITKLPIISWADDPDLNDIWCDGKGDSVRTFNKIVNAYLSQDLENRTYRNFGMYFYDTKNGTFSPKAFDPKPFGMYGVPGEPEKVVKQMRIEPLGDTTNQIQFLKNTIQSSVAQTPTERGLESGDRTLGEVEINLAQTGKVNNVTAKNYRRAWKESGEIFYLLLEANSKGAITLYKKDANGEYHSKEVFPTDWVNPKGYNCKVVLKQEKEAENTLDLQKLKYVENTFQSNPVAMKIAKKKELEILGWTPEEIKQVMEYEDRPMTTSIDPNNPDPNKVIDPKLMEMAQATQ